MNVRVVLCFGIRSKGLLYNRGIKKRDQEFKRWAIFIENTVYNIKKRGKNQKTNLDILMIN